MADRKTPNDIIPTTQQGGLVRGALNQLKLIFRLIGDSRVSLLAKVIPLGAFAYLLWPVDAVNVALPIIGPLDDAAILWLSSYIFTELCPPHVVAEHMKELAANTTINSQDEIVDAEATDVKDEPQQ